MKIKLNKESNIKLNKDIKKLLNIKTEEDLLSLENETGIPADRLQDLLLDGRKPSVSEVLAIHAVLMRKWHKYYRRGNIKRMPTTLNKTINSVNVSSLTNTTEPNNTYTNERLIEYRRIKFLLHQHEPQFSKTDRYVVINGITFNGWNKKEIEEIQNELKTTTK